jgi:hypothetical protein
VQRVLNFETELDSRGRLPPRRRLREWAGIVGLIRLPWLVTAAFVLWGLRRGALLMTATKIRAVGTEASATAMAPASTMSEAILTAVTLVVAIRPRVLLRLPAASDKCW